MGQVGASANCGRRGMSLVETMVALVVFGICIGGICALVVHSKGTSDLARDHYTAVNLAKNRIERAKEFGFDDLYSFLESDVVIDRSGNPSDGGRFRRTTLILTAEENVSEVVVTVEVRSRISSSFEGENEEVRTYIADFMERPE
ncbi:MAG: prepilin-type N-terminal cleavage/methylation domain-containing protein [Lentisphaerae bacterium]|nr:prepilin-type N-terminal cleavage/methylation domain-containing protein [Lentisphaerota bacterium]